MTVDAMEDDEDGSMGDEERATPDHGERRAQHMTSLIIDCLSRAYTRYLAIVTRLFYVSKDFRMPTRARSTASSNLPSCPIDPSDGGTSIDKKICLLKRRATATRPAACNGHGQCVSRMHRGDGNITETLCHRQRDIRP